MAFWTLMPVCHCSTCVAARSPSLWSRIKAAARRLARKGKR